MIAGRKFLLGAALLFFAAAPIQAASTPDEISAALGEMRERDQRLIDIGWKLVTANAPFCDNATADIGLLLLDTGSFPNPDKIAAALQTDGGILVQAAAAGSPAAEAGLASPMALIKIDDDISATPASPDKQRWEDHARARRLIAESLAANSQVELLWSGAHGRTIRQTVTGAPACNAMMEPRDGEKTARADGNRILVGSRFPGFSYPEDEFAAVIAHELAHIVLGHADWLDVAGRKGRRGQRNIRMTEREADRLTPWLLANAGYDPRAAGRFMRRWGPEYGGGLLRKRTHSGWDERAELMDEEAAKAAQAYADTSSADWSVLFVRDLPV